MIETFLQSAGNILLAVLGISFLIFVHELGHFIAARLFRVRVEVFSIGFGPRLLGRRRGDTDYRVSAIPLGGYVKMAGEYGDYDETLPATPDDLMSKPIWQRLVIFLAGPASNLVLAFLLFPAAFGGGMPFVAPVVGEVEPGGPAWQAGLQPGDEIVAVNGSPVYGFSDVTLEVAVGDADRALLTVRRGERTFDVTARPWRKEGRWDLGIRSSAVEVRFPEGGAAAEAGLRDTDRIVAVDDQPVGATVLGDIVTPSAAIQDALTDGEPLRVRVLRDGRELDVVVRPTPLPQPDNPPRLGALPLETRVAGLRRDAADGPHPLHVDDVLLAAGGQVVTDPLEVHAAALAALTQGRLELLVHRGGQRQTVVLDSEALGLLLAGDVALAADTMHTSRIRPTRQGALARAGLQPGDELVAVDARPVGSFTELQAIVEADESQIDYMVRYRRGDVERVVPIRARPAPALDYGIALTTVQRVHDVSFVGAIEAGLDTSLNTLRTTWLTLSKLFTGDVSADNLGGPLQIGYITYQAARLDVAQLLFFLALLSVNLGIINLLPIPVLDGGQIVFLLCEKVKGSRLSERFLQNAQLVGFVAIILLMVFVTVNDILKLSS